MVRPLSKIEEKELPTTSEETSGSSVYWRIPASGPESAASRKRAFTSAAVTSLPICTTKSTIDPSGTGARTATPSTFPARSGMTTPIAFAAPVDVGIS